MNYIDFQVKEKTYKLRLTTRNTVNLEKQLGCNPVAIFGSGDTIPTITVMVRILHAALQSLEHGITLDDAYDIFDAWLDEGHVMTDFIAIIIDIYKASGIIKNDNTSEKN
jgi:hypothetical protein